MVARLRFGLPRFFLVAVCVPCALVCLLGTCIRSGLVLRKQLFVTCMVRWSPSTLGLRMRLWLFVAGLVFHAAEIHEACALNLKPCQWTCCNLRLNFREGSAPLPQAMPAP